MAETREIYLAGGCFWGMQAYLDKDPCGYCHVDLGDVDRFVAEHQAEFGQAEQPASR